VIAGRVDPIASSTSPCRQASAKRSARPQSSVKPRSSDQKNHIRGLNTGVSVFGFISNLPGHRLAIDLLQVSGSIHLVSEHRFSYKILTKMILLQIGFNTKMPFTERSAQYKVPASALNNNSLIFC
jgi:hypothetical protein